MIIGDSQSNPNVTLEVSVGYVNPGVNVFEYLDSVWSMKLSICPTNPLAPCQSAAILNGLSR